MMHYVTQHSASIILLKNTIQFGGILRNEWVKCHITPLSYLHWFHGLNAAKNNIGTYQALGPREIQVESTKLAACAIDHIVWWSVWAELSPAVANIAPCSSAPAQPPPNPALKVSEWLRTMAPRQMD
jgi:hypothetical protein